jgi:hypothetical protein
MVLLGAAAFLSQSGGQALSHFPREPCLAAATINGRLAAVRRLAYEAADARFLSPELAASILRVKGPKKLGVRLGNGSPQTKRAASGGLLIRRP